MDRICRKTSEPFTIESCSLNNLIEKALVPYADKSGFQYNNFSQYR